MSDIDLIPHDYRDFLHKAKISTYWGMGFAVCIALMVIITLTLTALNKVSEQALSDLMVQKQMVSEQKNALQQLKNEYGLTERRIKLKTLIRQEVAPEVLFISVDKALEKTKIGLNAWDYARTLTHTTGKEIPLATSINPDNLNEPLVIEQLTMRHIWQLSGVAEEYTDLSNFVKGLVNYPQLESVTIKRTSKNTSQQERLSFDVLVSMIGVSKDD